MRIYIRYIHKFYSLTERITRRSFLYVVGFRYSARNVRQLFGAWHNQLGRSSYQHHWRRHVVHSTSQGPWRFRYNFPEHILERRLIVFLLRTRFCSPGGSTKCGENRFGCPTCQALRFPVHQSLFPRGDGWVYGNSEVFAHQKGVWWRVPFNTQLYPGG